jgi:hypothetical protein
MVNFQKLLLQLIVCMCVHGPYCLGALKEKQSEHSPLLQYLEIFDNIMNNVFLIILGQLNWTSWTTNDNIEEINNYEQHQMHEERYM